MDNDQIKKVAFLFGGPGAEREVSVLSAKSALPEFPSDYSLLPVFITPEKMWVVADTYVTPEHAWNKAQDLMDAKGVPADIALDTLEDLGSEMVFIGLHGEYGEDGTVQALLEARGIVYTGSDSEASAFAMDKPKVFQLLQDEDILVPEFLEIDANSTPEDIQAFADFRGFPFVVLPADRGSSVGVSIVKSAEELDPAIASAKLLSDRVLLSQFIAGQEVSCGVLVENGQELSALPPTDINPTSAHEFWDYEAKYVASECHEVTPSALPESVHEQIQKTAKRVHQLVGADGYSRTDMIVTPNHEVFVLEINTLPGMTPTSVLPQEAKVYGLSFGQLLATICENVDRSTADYITAEDTE